MKAQRIILAFALAVSILLLAGCNKKPGGAGEPTNVFPTDPTKNTVASQPASEQGQEKETEGATEAVLTPEEQASAALEALRKEMTETSRVFAVAYFGYVSDLDGEGKEFIQSGFPRLCQEQPFLTRIPEGNTAGFSYGEIYAIVPADPDATIAVTSWEIGGEHKEVIYEQDNGEPFLLVCNSAGSPDTQVTISGSDGSTVVWYPMLDKNLCVAQSGNEETDAILLDISSYEELLTADYLDLLDNEYSVWAVPVKEDLIDTGWIWEDYLEAGRYVYCQIIFRDGVADICWNDGIDENDHEYTGALWELTYKEGFALLTIDFDRFAGELQYNLLLDKENGQLFTVVDISDGHAETGLEILSRFLYRRYLNPPEPAELIGTWVQTHTLVEGDKQEVEDSSCTITITALESKELEMSYADPERPDSQFRDALLILDERALHHNCGNDVWVMDVDIIGPYNTTYAITLTEDGTLIKQNYFLLDGAPTVSYEYFSRVD